jgi:hypothetical protein
MNQIIFTPPITRREILSKNEGADGYVSSLSLLLSDANSKLFALHVATQENHAASSSQFEDAGEFPEPVLVVPAMTIDEQLIDTILTQTGPELLGLYLVPQEEAAI